jgi:hypothetical protein
MSGDGRRELLDEAYLDLSEKTRISAGDLRERAPERAGLEPGAAFGSLEEEKVAPAGLIRGLCDEEMAADEHARLALSHEGGGPGLPRWDGRKMHSPPPPCPPRLRPGAAPQS